MNKPSQVRCACRRVVFDGEVVKARVVRVFDEDGRPLRQAEALCRCKRWVEVPLVAEIESRGNEIVEHA